MDWADPGHLPGGSAILTRQTRRAGEPPLSPNWTEVVEQCREASGLPLPGLPVAMRKLRAELKSLPRLAAEAGIPVDILGRQGPSIAAVTEALAAL